MEQQQESVREEQEQSLHNDYTYNPYDDEDEYDDDFNNFDD
jgi:hypothetical protein